MAVWSRFIDTVMAKYQFKFVLCYADDCLVYTKTDSVDDHLRDVGLVFEQFEQYGIKVKASKLKIGVKEIPFLGVVLQRDGMVPNREKTKAITELKAPSTVGQLRRTLGIFAYYRKFIEGFSEIAAPLYALTGKGAQNKRNKHKEILLSQEAQESFAHLKKIITEEPIMLHFPDWTQPFEIHCDASKQAIAGILSQQVEGKERVIMYASRTLNPNEKKYQTYEQECLALVWAVELFRQYIRNYKTVVRTDCSALKSKKEGSRVMRWIMRLQEFDLDIQHRRGRKSGNVDALTRDSAQPVNPYGEEPMEELYNRFWLRPGQPRYRQQQTNKRE